MKRKGPPYKIEFCKQGQEPPPYVSLILKDQVVLGGSLDGRKDMRLGNEITFQCSGSIEENQEFIAIMLDLNVRGVAFSYDPKTHMGPGSIMLSFQDKGILTDEFKEISWRGPGDWLLTTYELE